MVYFEFIVNNSKIYYSSNRDADLIPLSLLIRAERAFKREGSKVTLIKDRLGKGSPSEEELAFIILSAENIP